MSYAEKMKALRLISRAYEEQDRNSTNAMAIKLRERNARKRREEKETAMMEAEDEQSCAERDRYRRKLQKAANAGIEKKRQARLMREIEEREARELGEPTDRAGIARAKERRRLLALDKLEDIRLLARNGGEQNFVTVLEYLMHRPLKDIVKKGLLPEFVSCARAKWLRTRFMLARLLQRLLVELKQWGVASEKTQASDSEDSWDDSSDDEGKKKPTPWLTLLGVLQMLSELPTTNNDIALLLIDMWVTIADTMCSKVGLGVFVSIGGLKAFYTIAKYTTSMRILQKCSMIIKHISQWDCGGSVVAQDILTSGALEMCDILAGPTDPKLVNDLAVVKEKTNVSDAEIERALERERKEKEQKEAEQLKREEDDKRKQKEIAGPETSPRTLRRELAAEERRQKRVEERRKKERERNPHVEQEEAAKVEQKVKTSTSRNRRPGAIEDFLSTLHDDDDGTAVSASSMPLEVEMFQRETREIVVLFLYNMSKHKSANYRLISNGAITIACHCIQWDRYNSRVRHESDLFHNLCIRTILKMLICLPGHKLTSYLEGSFSRAGEHQTVMHGKRQRLPLLHQIIAWILDRTDAVAHEPSTSISIIETISELRYACGELIKIQCSASEGVNAWRTYSESIKRICTAVIPKEVKGLLARMPEQTKTPRGLTNREMRAFLRNRRRIKPSPETLALQALVETYEAMKIELGCIYTTATGISLKNMPPVVDENMQEKSRKEKQLDLVRTIKRHSELFRVHYHASDAKRREGVDILLEALEQLRPSTPGAVGAIEASLPTMRDNWVYGIKTERMSDIFARSLSIVSDDEDAAARILRLGIGKHLVEIVRAKGTSPKRWYWIVRAVTNMSQHIRMRSELIKGNCLASLLACCQLAHSSGPLQYPAATEHERSEEERGNAEGDISSHKAMPDPAVSALFFDWEIIHLNQTTAKNVALALERLSINKTTRSWMVSKGVFLSLKRLVTLHFFPYVLMQVATTIENIVEERQAARMATKEGAMLILFQLWQATCNVKLVEAIDGGLVSSIKRKTKAAIFRIANHRCIEALDQILHLATYANYPEEKELVVSCSSALVTYSSPPLESYSKNKTAEVLIANPKFVQVMQRLASFQDENVLRALAMVGRNLSKFEAGVRVLSHPFLIYMFECMKRSKYQETKLFALTAAINVNRDEVVRKPNTVELLKGLIKSIND